MLDFALMPLHVCGDLEVPEDNTTGMFVRLPFSDQRLLPKVLHARDREHDVGIGRMNQVSVASKYLIINQSRSAVSRSTRTIPSVGH